MSECCICYDTFPVTIDNTISCNKTVHTLCADCKDKMAGGSCPMCRSHNIKPPSKMIIIPLVKKLKKTKSKDKTDLSRMSRKQRRNFHRKAKYGRVIGQNQIIRERTGWTTRYANQSSDYLMWFSDERVARYNGGETTEYDTDYSSDDSSDISLDDTVSTLSLTETTVGEMDAFSSDEEDSTEDEEVNGFIRFYIDRSLTFEENLRNYYNNRMLHS